jgi:hypothetical protein
MNERIKELYEQSLIRETGKDHAGNPMLVIKQNPEKFAELIVRDCLNIAKNWDNQLVNSELYKESNAVGIVVYRIARQFGVKE